MSYLTQTQIVAFNDLLNSDEANALYQYNHDDTNYFRDLIENSKSLAEFKTKFMAVLEDVEYRYNEGHAAFKVNARNFQRAMQYLENAQDYARSISSSMAFDIETLSDEFHSDEDFYDYVTFDESAEDNFEKFKNLAVAFLESLPTENPIPENLPLDEILDLVRKILNDTELATYLAFEARKFERK